MPRGSRPRLASWAEALGAQSTFQFGATEIGAAIRRILLDPGEQRPR